MAEGARTTTVGTAGGTNISPDMKPLDHAVAKKVLLSADYTFTAPPGYPTPPYLTGAATRMASTVIAHSGSTISLLKAEADALIAAGKATAV